MTKKKSINDKKELSQAGMARINLTFYTLSSVKRLIGAMKESIEEASMVCDILGQTLLYQIGLDDEDILRYYKEHLDNVKEEMKKEDSLLNAVSKDVISSLPFHYDEENDELVLSKKIDGEVEKLKRKFVEGFI